MHNITMDDVAKKASVSIATVSRVYTNPDKVSLKNRQKVFKAIEELNYQLNVLARNLRRLQTNTILVIFPNIIVDRQVSNINIPCVTNDNTLSTRIATEHLIQLGHQRIAYLSGTLGLHIAEERLDGYCLAIKEHGLTLDESLIREGDYYVDSGYELALELLSQSDVPTAIVAASDEMAIGAMKAARELGISIPDQLAIIGFDDIKMASMFDPPYSQRQACYSEILWCVLEKVNVFKEIM